jgi:hypothetical protein
VSIKWHRGSFTVEVECKAWVVDQPLRPAWVVQEALISIPDFGTSLRNAFKCHLEDDIILANRSQEDHDILVNRISIRTACGLSLDVSADLVVFPTLYGVKGSCSYHLGSYFTGTNFRK